jgi:16S rRNA processing protein RimM
MTQTRSSSSPSHLVLMGEFGRAQGVRGEVRLKSFMACPQDIATCGALQDEAGHRYEILGARPFTPQKPDMLVVRIRGVETREAAEKLNRIGLYLMREQFQRKSSTQKNALITEEEYWQVDLVGLEARSSSGEVLGCVLGLADFGAGQLLDIAPSQGQSFFVPFRKAFVPILSLEEGFCVIEGEFHLMGQEPA